MFKVKASDGLEWLTAREADGAKLNSPEICLTYALTEKHLMVFR